MYLPGSGEALLTLHRVVPPNTHASVRAAGKQDALEQLVQVI